MKLDTRDAKDHDVTRSEVEDHIASFELFYRSERDGLFASLCLITRDPYEAEELMSRARHGIVRPGISTEPRSTRSGRGTGER